jgi:DNA helicase-2/ATP-dependent DNA helicase PcrA
MSDELALKLCTYGSKGYVIAPAGYGKTHLIALAVKKATQRQLILTHTFAGVNSLKTKMITLGVPAVNYDVDTIASFSLRLCLAYPRTSKWKTDLPAGNQWDKLHESCVALLGKAFIRQVLAATYQGVYVDEYQDCSELQHGLVSLLGQFLPTRILGDPMQAIFEIGDQSPVDWNKSIYPNFECLGKLEKPWRWDNARQAELGAWLKAVRGKLENGEVIDLSVGRPASVKFECVEPEWLEAKQCSTVLKLLENDATVMALHGGDAVSKNKTHLLAQKTNGKFSSIEEIEGKALFTFIKAFEKAKTAQAGFLLAVEFSKKCFTKVGEVLTAGTKEGKVAKETKATKYPPLLSAANLYLSRPTSLNLKSFFLALKENPETGAYRRDLLYRFLNVLKIHGENETVTLLEAANLYHRDMRYTGRPISHRKLIGTTLLVKGLEYDHAVVLDADSLSAKHLYVAMTRGSQSLTIIGSSRYLPK